MLVIWSDHTLSYWRSDQIVWSREEALASVQSTMFIDLPSAKGAADGGVAKRVRGEGGLVPEGLKKWWRMQGLAVLVQFKLGQEGDKAELVRLREELR